MFPQVFETFMFTASKKTKVFFCYLIYLSSVAFGDVLTFRADEWCPYNCSPSDVQKPGFMVELVEAIFAVHGHRVDYSVENFDNSLVQARNNEITGVIGAVKNEAPDFIFPDEEQGISRSCVFVGKDNAFQYNAAGDLAKIGRIGAVKSYYYGDAIGAIKKGNPHKFILTDAKIPTLALIGMLKGKKIEALLENFIVFKYHIHETPEPIRLAGCEIEKKVFVAFGPNAKKNTAYAKILSDGMVQFRKNRKINFILSKYGLSDWK